MSNPYAILLRAAWRHAAAQRARLVLVYALFAASNLIAALQPALYGWFIDRIQRHPAEALRTVEVYGLAFLAVHLAVWLLHGPCRVAEQKLAFAISLAFLRERYHQALHLPLGWHQDHHSGATINRVRKGYEALKHFLADGSQTLFVPFNMAISLAAMMWFAPLFGAVGLIMGAITVWAVLRFDRPLVRLQTDVNEREHTLSATMFDTLSNIVTVITLRLEASMERGLLAAAGRIFPPFRRWAVLNESKWFVADTLVALTYAGVVIGYVRENWRPGAPFYVGGLIALIGYVNRFTENFHAITWQYSQTLQSATDVAGAQTIDAAYARQHRPDAPPPLPARWQSCAIRGLGHAHRDGEGARLSAIALDIARGERIALVGESGSGKSTLLALLRGLYPPEPGVVFTVDGIAAELGSLNETATLIPQEPEIFENTIVYNITLGLPFPEEEIARACEIAQFAPVLADLPGGLDASIKEKGINLSGGQKQRLALARGVLAAQASALVLLDEPTASVDPRTEQAIYQRLFAEFEGKAIVSALHRLHLLPMFDTICVLAAGRIVARGSFAALLRDAPEFQALWQHQEALARERQSGMRHI